MGKKFETGQKSLYLDDHLKKIYEKVPFYRCLDADIQDITYKAKYIKSHISKEVMLARPLITEEQLDGF